MLDKLRQLCLAFGVTDTLVSYEEFKEGNINATYKVNTLTPDGREKAYILQAVNTYVFKNPVWVMENIDRVTGHIRAKKQERATLFYHRTAEGNPYVSDTSGFWRMTDYIDSASVLKTTDQEVIRNAGLAFGEFQLLLADFDAASLFETIPDFHNTRKWYETLKRTARENTQGVTAKVQTELKWLLAVEDRACGLTDLFAEGRLPLRVVHNDTKISNVLFDRKDKSVLAVIDLDTVMPGLVGNDFGDAIRSAASLSDEDCSESQKAGLHLERFKAFTDGFLMHTAKTLTETELQTLPLSCFALTVELAVRFLNDYLMGSLYFKTGYPEHNLVCARSQITLAKDMLAKMDTMEEIIRECAKKYR